MRNNITLALNADTPADLLRMVAELAEAFGGNVENVRMGTTDGTSAAFVVETGAAKKGRARKKEGTANEGASGTDGAAPALVAEGHAGHDGPASAGTNSGVAPADAGGNSGVRDGESGVRGTPAGQAGSGGRDDMGATGAAGEPASGTDGNSGGAAGGAGVEGGSAGPGTGAVGTEGTDTVASGDAANVVQDLTQQEALDRAIADLQKFFAADANNMTHITKLQSKFGVKLFKEISLDRAHEFYADVKLLISGTPAV